jgi:hypothetical protein
MSNQMEKLAQQLAAALTYPDTRQRAFPIPTQLKSIRKALHAGYRYFEEAGHVKHPMQPNGCWIIFYVIDQARRRVAEAMPESITFACPRPN